MEDVHVRLLEATRLGDIDSLQRILPDDMPEDEVADLVNYQNELGETPLHIAASNGTLDIVQFIANKNAGINMTDFKGRTPLHCAAERGFVDVASFLVDSLAIMEAKDRLGRTPLYVAAEGGFQGVVDLLADNGADVNAFRSQGKKRRAALVAAAAGGHSEVVAALINHGARVNNRMKGEDSALLIAIQKGHSETVDVLIQNGADVNYANAEGETPLIAAARLGADDVFDAVLGARSESRKLNVNTANANNETALSVAVSKGYVHGVVALLGIDKIQTNPKLPDGATLVHLAAGQKFNDVLEILLDRGLDPDACDGKGNTPLHWAVSVFNNDDVITTLMSWGCDPAVVGHKGKNAFGFIDTKDRRTANLVSQLLEDEEIQKAIADRRQQKNEQAKEEMTARILARTSRMETAQQSKTKRPAPSNQARVAKMTRMGGTLRDTKRESSQRSNVSQARTRPQEARPWGGSRETEIFQRDIRCKIREMKRQYISALDEIEQELEALRDEVIGQSSEIFLFSDEGKAQKGQYDSSPSSSSKDDATKSQASQPPKTASVSSEEISTEGALEVLARTSDGSSASIEKPQEQPKPEAPKPQEQPKPEEPKPQPAPPAPSSPPPEEEKDSASADDEKKASQSSEVTEEPTQESSEITEDKGSDDSKGSHSSAENSNTDGSD